MPVVSIEEARRILGADVLGPEEAEAAFGSVNGGKTAVIPFDLEALATAVRLGEMLVFRAANLADATKLTIAHMIDAFPAAFDSKFLTKVGYQLRDEWGISLEPLAATETCAAGWALVRKDILSETRNLTYEAQDAVLQTYAESAGAPYRRRRAIEVVYDTVLYWKARGTPLLANTWDWTSSATIDGGYLNVGGFGDHGLQLFSYSRAVRHGAMGLCPTRP